MAKKFVLKGCPLCGEPAHWIKGNKSIKMVDLVQCLNCGLELAGDYEPESAVNVWNFRTTDFYIESSTWNIDGEHC